MKITRTRNKINIRTTTLAESTDHYFRRGSYNPELFDHPVRIGIGHEKEGGSLELLLTIAEAERLIEAIHYSLAKVREIQEQQKIT